MTIQNLDYFFDRQQIRFMEQLVRAFSGFQFQTGYNSSGAPQLIMVPCKLADTNRQVANLIRNNSENTLVAAPRITLWQTGLTGRRADVQSPNTVEKLNVVERQWIANTNSYTMNKGNSYTVERIMPLPFQMDVQLDIWTTNLLQKHQLLEQILTVIYPSFDIQNGQNPLDWTALTTVYVEDITFTSRNIPIGTDSEIDVASIRLRLPMWLSPPAKVKSQTIIQQIITNIYDETNISLYEGDSTDPVKTVITTPGDHWIQVNNSIITLLGPKAGNSVNDTTTDYNWQDLINQFGIINPTVSAINLYYTSNCITGPYVSGNIQYSTNAVNELIWNIDPSTIPANTISAINAIINPLKTFPGNGLPTPANGDRYLITENIGPSIAWGNITAYTNDIIQYNSGVWAVSFTSRTTTTSQLVLNNYTTNQLQWNGSDWIVSINTIYAPGYWRLQL